VTIATFPSRTVICAASNVRVMSAADHVSE